MNRSEFPWKRILAGGLLFAMLCVSVEAASAPAAMSLQTRYFRFSITAATGHCEIFDKQTRLTFGSAGGDSPFGKVTIRIGGKSSTLPLGRCDLEPAGQQPATAAFHPVPDNPGAAVRLRFETLRDEHTLQLTYAADPGLEIESISPLANVFTTTDSGKGYLLVPVREGLLIPADSGMKFDHRFDTYAYEGCHMEMIRSEER